MTGQAAQSTPVFLYDGDCAFCSSCARFAERWIPSTARVAAWQFEDLDALGVTVAQMDVAVVWVDHDKQQVSGPDAIAKLLKSSHTGWRVAGTVLGTPPVRAVAWPVYRWVSANRDRMPGGTATCALPAAQR